MTEPDFLIRKATLDDAKLLAALNVPIQRLHSDAKPEVFKQTTVDDPGIIGFFSAALNNPDDTIYILEAAGVPAGCVYARIIRRPESPFGYASSLILIDQISVNPEFQGRGYGKALMNAVFDLAKAHQIQRVVLDVWAFNTSAIQFYERMGFKFFNYRMDIDLSE
ncbi:MAG TPA: GNAT family N-acetyltransferase [Phototrophicaceae bacterium]|jgi:ribosomal protein S18 acetylase RimI-like enzyme|nr:GNAT family N-acetyltransferase [Phototrophicaceae bacterium]